MNKTIALLSLIAICISSCTKQDLELISYEVKAKIHFINETSDLITSKDGCQEDIAPNGTLTFNVDGVLSKEPSIDDFPTSIFYCIMMYKDGNASKCELGVSDIKNYENRKITSLIPLVFEFTFRFTEAKKIKAIPCN